MKNYYLVWSHTDEKLGVRSDNRPIKITFNKLCKLANGAIIWTSNLPVKYCEKLRNEGAVILRCNPNIISEARQGKDKSVELDLENLFHLSKAMPQKFRPFQGIPVITKRYAQFKLVQELRKRVSNQVWAEATPDEVSSYVLTQLTDVEKYIKDAVAEEIKQYPIWDKWMINVKGIGPSMAGNLIGTLTKLGIDSFNKPSSLRKYCGISATAEGIADQRKKGVKINYNPKMKALLLGVLAGSFLKSRDLAEKPLMKF